MAKSADFALSGSGTVKKNGAGVTTMTGDLSTFKRPGGYQRRGAVAEHGGAYSFPSQISGAGQLIKNAWAPSRSTAPTANTLTGQRTVLDGTLILQTSGGNAISGNVQIGDAIGGDVVQLGANDQIADTSIITFTAGGSGTARSCASPETTRQWGRAGHDGRPGRGRREQRHADGTLTINNRRHGLVHLRRHHPRSLVAVRAHQDRIGTQTLANTALVAPDELHWPTTITDGASWCSPTSRRSAARSRSTARLRTR